MQTKSTSPLRLQTERTAIATRTKVAVYGPLSIVMMLSFTHVAGMLSAPVHQVESSTGAAKTVTASKASTNSTKTTTSSVKTVPVVKKKAQASKPTTVKPPKPIVKPVVKAAVAAVVKPVESVVQPMRSASLYRNAARAIGLHPKPGTTYAGLSLEQAKTVTVIHRVFGARLFDRAVKIAWCESRLDPTATNHNTNGSVDHGVFQINDGGTMQGLGINRRQAMRLETNVAAALKLYKDRGWQPWVCAQSSH